MSGPPGPTKRSHLFSPSKPSPLGKRPRPTTPSKTARNSPSKSASRRAAPGSAARPGRQIRPEREEAEDEEEEEESEYESESEEEAGLSLVAPGTTADAFVTRSAGDAYLLQAGSAPKTSDNLLSTTIDPAFTFSTYQQALHSFDTSQEPQLAQARELAAARVEAYAAKHPRWAYQLEQGFNLAFYGFGSKKLALDQFAEYLRARGTVIVVNGYDSAVSLADVVTAIEDVVRQAQEAEDAKAAVPIKRKRGRPPKTPTKAATAPGTPATPSQPRIVAAAPATQVSALEGRIRRVCSALRAAPQSMPDLFLVVHNLDSPSLRPPKVLTLLALLAAQPKIHLATSTDHIRAASILPTALATARPPPPEEDEAEGSVRHDARAFTFLHVELTTLQTFSLEVFHSGTLSSLFPPTIYPPMSTALDPSSASLLLSTTHVVNSVTARSRRLFQLLAQQQLDAFATLPSAVARALLLTPRGPLAPAPVVAIKLELFKTMATDQLYATSGEQVDALLAEFRDHNVVRGSKVAPVVEGAAAEEAAAGSGAEWVWIPLNKEALQEVIDDIP